MLVFQSGQKRECRTPSNFLESGTTAPHSKTQAPGTRWRGRPGLDYRRAVPLWMRRIDQLTIKAGRDCKII